MKKMLSVGISAGLAAVCFGGSMDTPQIARYAANAKAALSLTFDDGFRHQVANARSVLDPLGIRGTFFVIPYSITGEMAWNFVTWDTLKEMHALGHEIGTHASIKTKLHEADVETVDHIINGGWERIRDNIGVEAVSFAYPGGSKKGFEHVEKIIAEHHPFVRGSVFGYGSVEGRRQWTLEKGQARMEEAMANGEWVTGMVHAIIKGYSPFKSIDEFRTHCEWLVTQDLWLAPMGEVARYVAERDTAELNVLKSSKNALTFELTCDLDPKIYNQPLTVIVPTGDGQKLVDAVPNSGPITVEW